MEGLNVQLTQAEFGELIGVTQQAVAGLLQRGVLVDGAVGEDWLIAYCEHLREIAAGRGGEEGVRLNLENTRATIRGKNADNARKELALAEKRRELMPTYLLEEVLAKASSRAGRILDTIPGEVRRRLPQLTSSDIAAVTATVARARNLAAQVSLADLEISIDAAADQDTESDEALQAEADAA